MSKVKDCILERLKKAAMELHGVDEIFPSIHNCWRMSYSMVDMEELGKHHMIEYKLDPEELTSHSIMINMFTGKTLQEELGETD